jgi:hypothetical protein
MRVNSISKEHFYIVKPVQAIPPIAPTDNEHSSNSEDKKYTPNDTKSKSLEGGLDILA